MKRLPIQIQDYRVEEHDLENVCRALKSGRLTEGEYVAEFEANWAAHVGTQHAVAVSSGTAALFSGLLAAKYLHLIDGPGVLTTPATYIATANSITLAGFSPYFCDIAPESLGTLDPEQVVIHLSGANAPKIGAILAVHTFGVPDQVDKLLLSSAARGVILLEDAAQAHGSTLKGKCVGGFGAFGAFSFRVGHTLQAGEMGAVTTDNAELADMVRRVKNNGRAPRPSRTTGSWFDATVLGLNLSATELDAVLALAALRRLATIVAARKRNAQFLSSLLQPLSGVLELPVFPPEACPFAYPVVIADDRLDRDAVCQALSDSGVECRPMFPCIPTQQPSYRSLRRRYLGGLPVAERLGDRGLYVGCHEHLSIAEIERLGETISAVVRQRWSG